MGLVRVGPCRGAAHGGGSPVCGGALGAVGCRVCPLAFGADVPIAEPRESAPVGIIIPANLMLCRGSRRVGRLQLGRRGKLDRSGPWNHPTRGGGGG